MVLADRLGMGPIDISLNPISHHYLHTYLPDHRPHTETPAKTIHIHKRHGKVHRYIILTLSSGGGSARRLGQFTFGPQKDRDTL